MSRIFQFKKVACDGVNVLSAYEVFMHYSSIGFVWKVRGFSYRGMQGWNRGIRLRDYHPTHWEFDKKLDAYKAATSYSRQTAAERLSETKS